MLTSHFFFALVFFGDFKIFAHWETEFCRRSISVTSLKLRPSFEPEMKKVGKQLTLALLCLSKIVQILKAEFSNVWSKLQNPPSQL